MSAMPQMFSSSMSKFVLLAIPYFILAGNIMDKAQIFQAPHQPRRSLRRPPARRPRDCLRHRLLLLRRHPGLRPGHRRGPRPRHDSRHDPLRVQPQLLRGPHGQRRRYRRHHPAQHHLRRLRLDCLRRRHRRSLQGGRHPGPHHGRGPHRHGPYPRPQGQPRQAPQGQLA